MLGSAAGQEHAHLRRSRGLLGVVLRLRPRRMLRQDCSADQVLLPDMVLPRHADASHLSVAGLEIVAAGLKHRRIAPVLCLSADTTSGWIRRFCAPR